jgi:putative hydrolase of the HAD superfamily
MIPVVLFDLDDTLFAHRTAVDRGIVTYLHALGIVPDDPAAAALLWHDLEERHYHRYLAGELDFEGQRRARARDFAATHGLELADLEAGAWFDAYFEHYRAAWVLHDDALPCLAAIAPPARIGIITNGDPAFQRRKLDQVGLGPLVEHLIASGALGYTKPDPRIFAHACELFGVAPADALYVGDRLRTDAIGAAEAGLVGVWLDRGAMATVEQLDEARDAGVRVIRTLTVLPAIVGAARA